MCKVDKGSDEYGAKFKYFGTAVTNTNCVNEEINSTLMSGNACYHRGLWNVDPGAALWEMGSVVLNWRNVKMSW